MNIDSLNTEMYATNSYLSSECTRTLSQRLFGIIKFATVLTENIIEVLRGFGPLSGSLRPGIINCYHRR